MILVEGLVVERHSSGGHGRGEALNQEKDAPVQRVKKKSRVQGSAKSCQSLDLISAELTGSRETVSTTLVLSSHGDLGARAGAGSRVQIKRRDLGQHPGGRQEETRCSPRAPHVVMKVASGGLSEEQKQPREAKEHKNLASSSSYHKAEEKHPRRIS
uniref:Uncharacterized protein n=1 Tax=Rangifer tarandus platyrhynchus TaxID=3082113 RepID=A0ACB0EI60_RANTA|nr:unnamed protein product [Rangifer tarandus platyrhynchus]